MFAFALGLALGSGLVGDAATPRAEPCVGYLVAGAGTAAVNGCYKPALKQRRVQAELWEQAELRVQAELQAEQVRWHLSLGRDWAAAATVDMERRTAPENTNTEEVSGDLDWGTEHGFRDRACHQTA